MPQEKTTRSKRLHLIFLILIVILGTAYFSLSYNSTFYAPDEGATAYHFQKCVEGAVQHRDFYSVYGMGFYFLGKTLFEFFGSRLIVMRLFVFVLKLLMAVVIYYISLNIVRPAFAFLASLGFIIWWGDPLIATTSYLYPSHISQLLGLLSLLLVFLYFEKDRKVFIFFSAMTLGFSALFKPTIVLFNLMAFFLVFFAREMFLDLTDANEPQSEAGNTAFKVFLGKAWLVLLLVTSITGVALLTAVLIKFGLDFVFFVFFLLASYLMVAYLLNLMLSVSRLRGGSHLYAHARETLSIFVLIGIGILFWELLQVAYFARYGALKDFAHMFSTASAYYSDYAISFWHGPYMVLACCGALLTVFLFGAVMKATVSAQKLWKTLVASLGIGFALFLLVLWYLLREVPRNYHITVWYTAVIFPVVLSFFIIFKNTPKAIRKRDIRKVMSLLLVTFYASTNSLDAFPKVDIGHISSILPPLFILLGFLAEGLYDSWRTYLATDFPRAAKYVAGAILGFAGVGVFLPSIFMAFMFQFLVITSRQYGWGLYQGRLIPVPRYHVTVERARGLALHVFSDEIGAPVLPPKTISFFDVAEEISRITQKGDKVFSTMTSGLMLYFLSDRDSIGGKANCYVWQTVQGTTTSNALEDFSDVDLTRMIQQERPKAIIVEPDDVETKRFAINWPGAWNFILSRYRVLETIGPYQIYVPDTQR